MKHNSVDALRSIPPIRRTLSTIAIVLSLVFALAAFGEPVATSWTYQGQLRRSGAAYTGTCNFQFSLWDAASAGTEVNTPQSINGVNVANGLFTVILDFDDRFTGDARWLGTSVQCSGDGGFTPLDPRQPVTAAPYALSLRPGARIEGGSTSPILTVTNSSTFNGSGGGIYAIGTTGVHGETNRADGNGVLGVAADADSVGVYGFNYSGVGVRGLSEGTGPGILGENTGSGYAGQFTGSVGITGALSVVLPSQSTARAISGFGGITGVFGLGHSGVLGQTQFPGGVGVYGLANGDADSNSAGVFGENISGAAIWGKSDGAGSAIYGQATSSGYAGRFTGSVLVEGNLIVGGSVLKSSGNFRIDHPLDPANKFLSHSFVESPDMKNVYDGNVTTDATGRATVILPDYFEALNRDYRYQLTVLGQFAQAIVSREIAGNSFEIHTDKPGVKVSWQVTGIRQDAYAQAHPIVVEESKPAEEQGLYLFPTGFGAGEENQIGYPSRPATAPGAQEPPVTGPGNQASK
jgi:hypothetical protein